MKIAIKNTNIKFLDGYDNVTAIHWNGADAQSQPHAIAVETPVSLVYNEVAYAVMMATPADLEAFALGFSLSEGIITNAKQLAVDDTIDVEGGIVINMTIPKDCYQNLARRSRNIVGRTSCGMCGVKSIKGAIPNLTPIAENNLKIPSKSIYKAYEALHHYQPVKDATGAVHAAAWADADGRIVYICEDVGRHNALDKLIGTMVGGQTNFSDGFCLITSRCSYEMVQKSVQMGIGFLAAISAPTTLAVQIAEQHNMTLAALVRHETFTIFTHQQRVEQ